MITSIAFMVYPVSQMERARAFYEHVLGLHVSHLYERSGWNMILAVRPRHHDDGDGPYSGSKGSHRGL